MLSMGHLLLVAIVVLLLFGAGRFPRIMEDFGKGITSFKRGLKDEDDRKALEDKDTTPAERKAIEDKTDQTRV